MSIDDRSDRSNKQYDKKVQRVKKMLKNMRKTVCTRDNRTLLSKVFLQTSSSVYFTSNTERIA